MSSAFYPLGMKSYNNHVPQGGYKSWKGTGVNSFPVAITPGNIRPFTNKDYTNNFASPFGRARPIKHYRIGRGFNYPVAIQVDGATQLATVNRSVKSSTNASHLIKQLIDDPGTVSTLPNRFDETTNEVLLDDACGDCRGVGVVVDYKPNLTYLTNNPEVTTTNPPLCCNEEKKASVRVLPSNTNLPRNYYTSHAQYLQNRCSTYQQRSFNGASVSTQHPLAKPGSPLAIDNIYTANCFCNADVQQATVYALVNKLLTAMRNDGIITAAELDAFYAAGVVTIQAVYNFIQTLTPTALRDRGNAVFTAFVNNPYYGIPASGPVAARGCNNVVYKPNNYQYAKQGSVSSSTRMLKLNVDTITKNAATMNPKNRNFQPIVNWSSEAQTNPFVLKSKVPPCNAGLYAKNGNPKTCSSLAPVSTNKVDFNAGRNGYKTFVQNITA